MNPNITMDKGTLSAVVTCECGWRVIRCTPAAAWTAVAKHLKAEHGNPASAFAAKTYAQRAQRRQKAPTVTDDETHGTHRPAEKNTQPSRPH